MKKICIAALLFTSLTACGDDDTTKTDKEYQDEVVASMHDTIGSELADLVAAAKELQAAAPSTAWGANDPALPAMIAAWKKARVAYEHVEGATAPLFGDLDFTMDARYDDYLVELGAAGDQNLFDDEGVTGMHGIERILFSNQIRAEVVAFERDLPGYKVAAFPSTTEEALAFKNELVQALIDDATMLHDVWTPAQIDLAQAFQGLIGLMNEQAEKVNLAATGEEESRYANITLFDLRNNLEGTKTAYGLFRAWIATKDGGTDADAKIEARFAALDKLYSTDNKGDSLPEVPADWSSDAPTTANLATPFGVLWKTVREDVDPNTDGSTVFEMNKVAVALGFPQFVAE